MRVSTLNYIMKTQQEIHLKTRPDNVPTPDDFELAEYEMNSPGEGEILVENEWISVDPYMRGRMNQGDSYVPPFQIGEPMDGGCVGKVIESRNSRFSEGDYVLGEKGWRKYWISDGSGVERVDEKAVSPENYLGILGMTGMTAYVGLLEIGNLEEGQTVFVSAASGAVGSTVCQIAKIRNCKVVGSAGSREKIKWLKNKAGVDEAFNYKETDNISARVGELCPDGIDLYFDNVGGDHLGAAIDHMKDFSQIVCCGMISGYNNPQPGPANLFKIIGKRLLIEGFIVRDHLDLRDKFVEDMTSWIQDGKITWENTVTEGLKNAPIAFIDLFRGDKMGKALVKLK